MRLDTFSDGFNYFNQFISDFSRYTPTYTIYSKNLKWRSEGWSIRFQNRLIRKWRVTPEVDLFLRVEKQIPRIALTELIWVFWKRLPLGAISRNKLKKLKKLFSIEFLIYYVLNHSKRLHESNWLDRSAQNQTMRLFKWWGNRIHRRVSSTVLVKKTINTFIYSNPYLRK